MRRLLIARNVPATSILLIVAALLGAICWFLQAHGWQSDAADPCQKGAPELMKAGAHCFLDAPL
jgi:hypothetical protein